MPLIPRLIISFSMLALSSTLTMVYAQVTYESFYSRSGLGDLQDNGFIHLESSGWLSTTYRSNNYINHKNPASYASLVTTAYDFGFDVSNKRVEIDNGDSRSFWQGNLNYLSLAFPLINPLNKLLDHKESELKLGFNLALVPYSRVGYRTDVIDSLQYTSESTTAYLRQYEGDGGTYRLITGVGASYKDFSLGINIGYLFGKIENRSATLFPSNTAILNNYYSSAEQYSGFYYNIGMMYDYYLYQDAENSNNNKILTLGLTYHGAQSAKVNADQLHLLRGSNFRGLDLPDESSGMSLDDTISIASVTNNIDLPSHLGIGFRYQHGNQYSVGIDIENTRWSEYNNNIRPSELDDAFKISAGLEYVKDANSLTSISDRIRYRAGIKYETDPRLDLGEQLKRYEARVGIGLPVYFSRQVSFINLGLGYGILDGSQSSESTLRFDLGVTLNDNLWFYKRRFD